MRSHLLSKRRAGLLAGLLVCTVCGVGVVSASDHGDTPLLISAGRNDARITDLFAFTHGDNLVLILCVDPAIPADVLTYKFPSDVEYRILIDNHTPVSFDNASDLQTYGGTILDPTHVGSDAEIRVRFNPQGKPLVQTTSMKGPKKNVAMFTGLRDDPFIRGPRIGRNVAAMVFEVPLASVVKDQSTLLIWATSSVRGFEGPIQDLVGRSLRSQFLENDAMNSLEPRLHATLLGVQPDVMIYDTSRPALYPNGRLLTDDVVDLVGDPRLLMNDAPFPATNDVPFLNVFPYLAPPHVP